MDPVILEGLVEVLLSSLLFGSAYVPIKKFDFGDGIYSLQIRCISILCCGFLTFAYTGFSHFYPLAMIGGVIWTIANLIIMPCIAELGLGMAVLLYSFTNCLTNWVTGNFGLFWTNARPPNNDLMNYAGLIGLLIGGGLVTIIKPEKVHQKLSTITTISAAISIDGILPKQIQFTQPEKKSWIGDVNWRRIIAILVALLAGFLFGEDPTPVIIVQDNYEGAPQNGLYYIFSFYFGIFLSSSIVFSVYCVVKKNKPFVNAELTLASLLSGVIWSIAQGLFIISMGNLSVSVAGPIASVMPACVASVWSIFYFKEIRGGKNFLILGASITSTLIGTILIAISK